MIRAYTAFFIGLSVAAAAAGAVAPVESETPRVVDRLLAEYGRIDRISCDLRREIETDRGRVRFLSRIYWERGGRLHVDNLSPLPRTIVSDGTNFFSHVRGDPKGFSRPVAALDQEMAIGLVKIPGTAMEHLLLLRDAPETRLPPADGLIRVGYTTPRLFAVLGLDGSNRLARLELFSTRDRSKRTALFEYTNFREVKPGVWIPLAHTATLDAGAGSMRETVRVDRLDSESPIAPNLFNPALFFEGVRFENSFDRIYE